MSGGRVSSRRSIAGVAVGAVLAIWGGTTAAADPAAARQLFDEARALVDQGAYEKACPKFEASLQLSPGIGTRFNLADCWEHVGKTASAWAEYLAVAAAAKAAGQAERERIARERASALEPVLARLVIDVRAADPELEVLRDGVPFAKASWGSAVPIDPGSHKIEARARNKQPWSAAIDIPKRATITATVPALADDSLAPGAGPARAETATTGQVPSNHGASPESVSSSPSPSAWSAQAGGSADTSSIKTSTSAHDSKRMAGYILAGAGVVGLGAGVVLGLMTNTKDGDAREVCRGSESACPANLVDQHDSLLGEARDLRTGAYLATAIGGIALVSGAVLILTSPKHTASAQWRQWGQVALAPALGYGTVGGNLSARW